MYLQAICEHFRLSRHVESTRKPGMTPLPKEANQQQVWVIPRSHTNLGKADKVHLSHLRPHQRRRVWKIAWLSTSTLGGFDKGRSRKPCQQQQCRVWKVPWRRFPTQCKTRRVWLIPWWRTRIIQAKVWHVAWTCLALLYFSVQLATCGHFKAQTMRDRPSTLYE